MKASVIIANFNSSKFVDQCIQSLNSQTYENIEIIFFDDNSTDNSLEIVKKYKNVKVIENKIQTKFGSLNQINAFQKCIEKSTGDIIFFLDSDDFFSKSKIEKVVKIFEENDNKCIIFDFPILLNREKQKHIRKKNNFLGTYWGYIHPTSCISIKKKNIKKILDTVLDDKFSDIWIDLRILLFAKYFDKYETLNENLTFYRQTEFNVSSNFKKYSKKWWLRRNDAHNYLFELMKKNNKKISKNLDYYVTKFVTNLIK